jgi:hypothetical protein
MFKQKKRMYPRAELTWPVSAQVGGSLIEGVTKNVGVSGAYVCCARPLRLNSVFAMVINTPDKPLNIKAEVVWANIPVDRKSAVLKITTVSPKRQLHFLRPWPPARSLQSEFTLA